MISNFHAKSWRVGTEGRLDFRLFKNNDLTIGGAYEYYAVDDASLQTNVFNAESGLPPNALQDIQNIFPEVNSSSFQHFAAFFAQDRWQIRDTIDLTLGFRGDYFSDFGGIVTPKVGMTYEPVPFFNVKLLFGSAFRIPSFIESFIEPTTQSISPQEQLFRTDLVVQESKQPKEYTWVVIHDEPAENWLVGGLTGEEVKAKALREKK